MTLYWTFQILLICLSVFHDKKEIIKEKKEFNLFNSINKNINLNYNENNNVIEESLQKTENNGKGMAKSK